MSASPLKQQQRLSSISLLSKSVGHSKLGSISHGQVISIENYDLDLPKPINRYCSLISPKSMKAMAFLFFTQADLQQKDYSAIRGDFGSTDEFDRFNARERKRVEMYIERVKERRKQIEKEEAKEAEKKLKLTIRKKKQQELLIENEEKLKALETVMQKEERELKLRKEQEERDKKAEEEERKKLWENDNKEWKEYDRERSLALGPGSKIDNSWLSKSFYKRNKSLAELKYKVKPRIENMSVILPRPQEYVEAHSKVRTLKDIIQLSDQSQRSLKIKQKKEMEMILNTELNIKKKQEEKEKYIQKKIEIGSQKLGLKQKKLEQNLDKLEEDRMLRNRRLKFEREQRNFNIDRTQRSMEFQLKLKLEQLNEEDEKCQEMRKNTEKYKIMRHQFRQQLIEDMEKLKSGEIELNEIKEKYKSTLINESDIINSPVSKSMLDSPVSSKRNLISSFYLREN